MKRSFIFLLGLLCIIMVEAKNHYFKHLGVSDGLSQVCIFSIYQAGTWNLAYFCQALRRD